MQDMEKKCEARVRAAKRASASDTELLEKLREKDVELKQLREELLKGAPPPADSSEQLQRVRKEYEARLATQAALHESRLEALHAEVDEIQALRRAQGKQALTKAPLMRRPRSSRPADKTRRGRGTAGARKEPARRERCRILVSQISCRRAAA